jgi:hypothetical protein
VAKATYDLKAQLRAPRYIERAANGRPYTPAVIRRFIRRIHLATKWIRRLNRRMTAGYELQLILGIDSQY